MEIRDWIALFGVIGTGAMFVAAIWGERIRSWLFKPQLRLELGSPCGELITETLIIRDLSSDSQLQQQYQRDVRRYLVSVRNIARWPIAHNVQIILTQLETKGPDGTPKTVWTGELPLAWVDREIYPLLRTVGRPARAAIIVVANDTTANQKKLYFSTLIEPSNFTRSYIAAVHLWVTLLATSDETDSQISRLEIAWDGQWDDGESEMAKHLIIRKVG